MSNLTLTQDTSDLLAAAVQALAARDSDHATEANDVGYNGSDTGFGNRLAATPVSEWKPANRRAAWEMLRKYRRQLSSCGIEYDQILEPPAVQHMEHAKSLAACRVDYRDGVLTMFSPYNPRLVEKQRSIPGRRWDGGQKVNTFPPESAPAIRVLLAEFADMGWTITPSAQAAFDGKVGGTVEPAPPAPQGPVAAQTAPLVQPAKVRVVWIGETQTVVGVRFDFDRKMVEAIKRNPGSSWNAERRVWEVTLDEQSAAKLVNFLSANRPVWCEDGVRDKILSLARDRMEQDKMRKMMTTLSKAEDADIEIEGLGAELKPFQRAGVDYVLRAARRSFIADDMGTGKTVQALAAVQAVDAYPAIVVCPASVKLSWRDHVQGPLAYAPEGWLPGRKVVVLDGMKGEPAAVWGADVIVLNWDILEGWREVIEETVKPRAVIYDESHYAKSPGAARTQAALALSESVLETADPMLLNLTGTAVLNKPVELATQLALIGRLDEFGGRSKIVKRKALEKFNKELRGTCFVRRMKKDVMSELEEKQIARVPVTLSNPAEYKEVEQHLIRWLMEQVERDEGFAAELADLDDVERKQRIAERKADKAEKAARAEVLVRINALRRVCAKGKLKAANGWVANFLDSSEEKLIVFACHKEVQRSVLKAFPGAAHVLGDDSSRERDAQITRFQTDPSCRLIVCSLAAAGEGITLTASSNVAFLELDWTPAKHDQAEDRAHRMGQEGNVVCWYLLADGTIDDDMHALIESKRVVVTATTDGVATDREGSILGELEARLIAKGLAA